MLLLGGIEDDHRPLGDARRKRRRARRYDDDVRLDEQGNIFSALPRATYTPGVAVSTTYVPVVSMVTTSSAGTECQSAKTEAQMLGRLGVAPGMAAMA